MRIGYVGLDFTGSLLASRLARAHEIVVWDTDPATFAQLERLGAKPAASAVDLARACDIVMICLPRSSDVSDMIFGVGGLAEGLSASKLVIDQSGGDPARMADLAERLAQRGVTLLDAPVTDGAGGPDGDTIAIFVSGPRSAFEQALPVLQAMSQTVEYCGERVGDAQAMKLVNTMMTATSRAATLEIVAMGSKMGLSLETMSDVMNKGTGVNITTKTLLPALLEGKPLLQDMRIFDVVRDLTLATNLAEQHGVPMLVTNTARGVYVIGLNILGESARLGDIVRAVETTSGARVVPSGKTA